MPKPTLRLSLLLEPSLCFSLSSRSSKSKFVGYQHPMSILSSLPLHMHLADYAPESNDRKGNCTKEGRRRMGVSFSTSFCGGKYIPSRQKNGSSGCCLLGAVCNVYCNPAPPPPYFVPFLSLLLFGSLTASCFFLEKMKGVLPRVATSHVREANLRLRRQLGRGAPQVPDRGPRRGVSLFLSFFHSFVFGENVHYIRCKQRVGGPSSITK